MVLIITFVNILLLYGGTYAFVKKITIGDSRALTILTSAISLAVALSFMYYLMLVLSQSFVVLLTILSAINLAHIFFTRDFFKNYRPKLLSNSHIWPLAATFFLTSYFILYASKYGSWDAFAMWNLHAKFFYHPELWKHLFTSKLSYSALDYPMMLPSIVAFFWNAVGSMSPYVPLLFAYGVMLAIPLYTYFALRDEGLKWLSLVALVIFVTDNNFKQIATSQCADSLLSLLILMVFVQCEKLKGLINNRAYLLGFICASCAWVKNEGLVFYLLFTVGFILSNYRHFPVLKKYFTGAIVPTIVLASFKLFFAPANDLISADNKQLFSLSVVLTDWSRYATICKFWLNTLVSNYIYGLILIFAAFVVNRRFFASMPAIIIALMLLGYFIIYLITPHDLGWHLYTSLYRVFQHIYPALIYLLLLSFKNIYKSEWSAADSAGI